MGRRWKKCCSMLVAGSMLAGLPKMAVFAKENTDAGVVSAYLGLDYMKYIVGSGEVIAAEMQEYPTQFRLLDIVRTDAGETAREVIAPGQYPIMGKAVISVEDMAAFYEEQGNPYPDEVLGAGGAGDIETFCRIYYEEAKKEGVRPEVAFMQAMLETGWLQYGGDAAASQFNFAGLGTTGGGVKGNLFPDVRTGIRAQIQHLKAYATADTLNQECVDDRYQYVAKGCAPYVELLGQQENPQGKGWATAQRYGYLIVDLIRKLTGA